MNMWRSWLGAMQRFHTAHGKRRRAFAAPRPSLKMEVLEDRVALATLTVNTLADPSGPDDGVLSLREAIAIVNESNDESELDIVSQGQIVGNLGDDVIQFDLGIGLQTINVWAPLP